MAGDPSLAWSSIEADADESRSARKRRTIMDAATVLFLRGGYQGTSMDEIAGLAQVSKQTVYANFADKERLFSEIVLGVAARSEAIVERITEILDGCVDLEQALSDLASFYVSAVLQPNVVALRRLVIAEATRFPELARSYFQRAPARAISTLALAFEGLAERGLLTVEDPPLAAGHFAYLVLSIPLDQALFHPTDPYPAVELERLARAGVGVFLAAYAAR